jgi:hypothetical protein
VRRMLFWRGWLRTAKRALRRAVRPTGCPALEAVVRCNLSVIPGIQSVFHVVFNIEDLMMHERRRFEEGHCHTTSMSAPDPARPSNKAVEGMLTCELAKKHPLTQPFERPGKGIRGLF